MLASPISFTLNSFTFNKTIQHKIQSLTSDEYSNMCHRIEINNWKDDESTLWNILEDYYNIKFNCLHFKRHNEFVTFITNSMELIIKIIHFNFTFVHGKTIYKMQIQFNDQYGAQIFKECKEKESLIHEVLNRRVKYIVDENNIKSIVLDLSNFNNDKTLNSSDLNDMITLSTLDGPSYIQFFQRISKDSANTTLILSSNSLEKIPEFCSKHFRHVNKLDLSNNQISSICDIASFGTDNSIRKLNMDGNPVCDKFKWWHYIKKLKLTFTMLDTIDGISLNNDTFMVGFMRNFSVVPHHHEIVDKFMTHFFMCMESNRSHLIMFYTKTAQLLFHVDGRATSGIPRKNDHQVYSLDQSTVNQFVNNKNIALFYSKFPEVEHDPTTFTVDVNIVLKNNFQLTIDGIFRLMDQTSKNYILYNFRQTFYLVENDEGHLIENEMFHITKAPIEFTDVAFKKPRRNYNSLSLIMPTDDQIEELVFIMSAITRLQHREAEKILKSNDWNLTSALIQFYDDYKSGRITDKYFQIDLNSGNHNIDMVD